MEQEKWAGMPPTQDELVRFKVALKRLRDVCVELDRPLAVLSVSASAPEFSLLLTQLWDMEQRLRSAEYRMAARSPSLFSTTETCSEITPMTRKRSPR